MVIAYAAIRIMVRARHTRRPVLGPPTATPCGVAPPSQQCTTCSASGTLNGERHRGELNGVIGARYRDLARHDISQAARAREHINEALRLRDPS